MSPYHDTGPRVVELQMWKYGSTYGIVRNVIRNTMVAMSSFIAGVWLQIRKKRFHDEEL